MSIERQLSERCGGKCELCGADSGLAVYEVPPVSERSADRFAMLCDVCRGQIDDPAMMDPNHWRCLNDSMWSTVPAVQVLACRMLVNLKAESWSADLREQLYLDEDLQRWADAGIASDDDAAAPTVDSNGTALSTGDSVTLIKDLVVKGANFTAKRGTLVKGISLTANPKHVEGRINGTQIVLVAAFLKKAN